jgi:hypothetical protein
VVTDLRLFPEHTTGWDSLRVDDSVLLFHDDRIHLVKGTAMTIWDAVDGRTSVEQIAAVVANAHPGAEDVSGQDEQFLLDLKASGFINFRTNPADEVVAVEPHVAWVLDEGLVTIADLLTGQRRTLSATASEVWMVLCNGDPLDTVATQVRGNYPDAGPELEEDVIALVSALVDAGYLRRLGV